MKKLLLATVASAAALVAQAEAQEPAYAWSGFYVGAQAGYGWSDLDVDADGDEYGSSEEGGLGGVHAGYDWQRGNFVYGLLGDIDFVAIDEHDIFESTGPGKFENYQYDLDWVATARVRAGFAHDRTLFYGSGGLAFGHMNASAEVDTLGGTFFDEWSGVKLGGAVGLGVEHAFTDRWSGRIEYVHHFFEDIELDLGGSPVTFNPSFGTVKFGISYRF
jgi:outer membrane immunogenic protein